MTIEKNISINSLTKDELSLLGDSLSLLLKSAQRSISIHQGDKALLAAFTAKFNRVQALVTKINQMDLI